MTIADVPTVLTWRNDPEIRSMMRTTHLIKPEEHAAYFSVALDDDTKRYLVFESESGERMGLVYLTDIDKFHRRATWGLFVGESRDAGIGTAMATSALDYVFRTQGIDVVRAEVLGHNVKSLRFHAKLGFRTREVELDAIRREGHSYDAHHLELARSAWLSALDSAWNVPNSDVSRRPIVIASTRHWNHEIVREVASQTGRIVHWIDRRTHLTRSLLDQLRPSYVFLPHWSFVVPEEVFDHYETVVFHMTDVPFGRGGSPLQNLIARGIYETQISALRCVRELDAGDVYAKSPLALYGSAEEIFLRARSVIARMITGIVLERPEPTPQRGEITRFSRRTPSQGEIADLESLQQVFDWIRMLDAEGYPKAFTRIGNFNLEFSRAGRYINEVRADVRITYAREAIEPDG